MGKSDIIRRCVKSFRRMHSNGKVRHVGCDGQVNLCEKNYGEQCDRFCAR